MKDLSVEDGWSTQCSTYIQSISFQIWNARRISSQLALDISFFHLFHDLRWTPWATTQANVGWGRNTAAIVEKSSLTDPLFLEHVGHLKNRPSSKSTDSWDRGKDTSESNKPVILYQFHWLIIEVPLWLITNTFIVQRLQIYWRTSLISLHISNISPELLIVNITPVDFSNDFTPYFHRTTLRCVSRGCDLHLRSRPQVAWANKNGLSTGIEQHTWSFDQQKWLLHYM